MELDPNIEALYLHVDGAFCRQLILLATPPLAVHLGGKNCFRYFPDFKLTDPMYTY
jgi:hypothetical protein